MRRGIWGVDPHARPIYPFLLEWIKVYLWICWLLVPGAGKKKAREHFCPGTWDHTQQYWLSQNTKLQGDLDSYLLLLWKKWLTGKGQPRIRREHADWSFRSSPESQFWVLILPLIKPVVSGQITSPPEPQCSHLQNGDNEHIFTQGCCKEEMGWVAWRKCIA